MKTKPTYDDLLAERKFNNWFTIAVLVCIVGYSGFALYALPPFIAVGMAVVTFGAASAF